MNDTDGTDGITMKEMIAQALENCADIDLLDLIYKLLLSEEAQSTPAASSCRI